MNKKKKPIKSIIISTIWILFTLFTIWFMNGAYERPQYYISSVNIAILIFMIIDGILGLFTLLSILKYRDSRSMHNDCTVKACENRTATESTPNRVYQNILEANKQKLKYQDTAEGKQRAAMYIAAKEQARKNRETRQKEKQEERERYNSHCPRCGSTKIQAGNRGYSLVTGFIGSGDVRFICMSCGHKWKPKR